VFDIKTVADRTDQRRGIDSQSLGLGFLGEITGEKEEEALHFGVKGLPGNGILDGCDEMSELVLHRLCCSAAGRGLEVEVRSTSDAVGTG
jgi:hypothetical protein